MCVAVNTKRLQTALRLRHEPAAFRSGVLAESYANRCVKPHYVVQGDFPIYLVVCPADATKLARAGYELLRPGAAC